MASSNLHFFTGENTYALQREVLEWKRAFREKHGAENMTVLSGKDDRFSDLLDAVSVMPFIAEKRLAIIQGLPKIDREELKSVIEAIHPQTIVLIVEPSPDKRLGIVKDLLAEATVKTFASLSPKDLLQWGKGIASGMEVTMTDAAFQLLRETVGTDQWMLDCEIRKLASSGHSITPEHVQSLAVPGGDQVLWKLTDLIGSRKPEEAIRFLSHRLDRGEDPYGVWVILLSMVKNLALVWAGIEGGLKDERSISVGFGMHFLSVRGLLPLARSLKKDALSALVHTAALADLELKTGGYHYTAERQEELIALTERLILMCK